MQIYDIRLRWNKLPKGYLIDLDGRIFKTKKLLGQGAYSIAYLCTDMFGGRDKVLVFNVFNPQMGFDNDYIKGVLSEYHFQSGYVPKHFPNIQYVGSLDTDTEVYLMEEYFYDEKYFSEFQLLALEILHRFWVEAEGSAYSQTTKKYNQILEEFFENLEEWNSIVDEKSGDIFLHGDALSSDSGRKTYFKVDVDGESEEFYGIWVKANWNQDEWESIVSSLKEFVSFTQDNFPELVITLDIFQKNCAKSIKSKHAPIVFVDPAVLLDQRNKKLNCRVAKIKHSW